PVVDGNVYRVLSRIFGISTPIDSAAGKKEILDLAAELLDRKNPGIFNQAIMEFGAIQCVPQNPDCLNCPFLHTCHARRKDLINKLPVKARKTKVRDRYFHYLVIRKKGKVYVRQRTGDDIWKNLFDFPLIESKKALEPFALARTPEWKTIFRKNGVIIKGISGSTKHILTHQRLHIRFIELTTKNAPLNKNWQQVNESEIKKLAVPVPIQNYLEK
ncbi:MAG TPA: NUDIX domain-containing protein, partial [Bacteroidia bacterium]|nr:NUDIX domain-containing protein [Bacteroidia bacterium]